MKLLAIFAAGGSLIALQTAPASAQGAANLSLMPNDAYYAYNHMAPAAPVVVTPFAPGSSYAYSPAPRRVVVHRHRIAHH